MSDDIKLPPLPPIQRCDYVGGSYPIGNKDDGDYVDYGDHVAAMCAYARNAVRMNMQPQPPQWQPISTAPRDGRDILVWWPMRALDDEGLPTGEIVDGRAFVSAWVIGGYWWEPKEVEDGCDEEEIECGFTEEPTEEMFRAGMMRSLETGSVRQTWRAMVKAATQKDQQS